MSDILLYTVILKPWREANWKVHIDGDSSQFENKCLTEMFSGSEAGSYVKPMDFMYHTTLGLRVTPPPPPLLLSFSQKPSALFLSAPLTHKNTNTHTMTGTD